MLPHAQSIVPILYKNKDDDENAACFQAVPQAVAGNDSASRPLRSEATPTANRQSCYRQTESRDPLTESNTVTQLQVR